MFKLFKSAPKSFQVRVVGSETEFSVARESSLLSSALSAGVEWPFKCKVGSCGKCKCQLLEGKIKPQLDFSYVLDGPELQQGYILACQTMLKSDILVKVDLDD